MAPVLHLPPICRFTRLLPVPGSLLDRSPQLDRGRLVRELVPPPRFDAERFSTYRPDPARAEPGRARSSACEGMPRGWVQPPARPVPAARQAPRRPGGASTSTAGSAWARRTCWRRCGTRPTGPRPSGPSSSTRTSSGRWGSQPTVEALSGHQLVCIDEFELDDPGDTVLDGDPARAAGRRLGSRSPPRPTRCPTPWGRAGSRPRTSCARSRRCRRGSTCSRWTGPTTGTATPSTARRRSSEDEVRRRRGPRRGSARPLRRRHPSPGDRPPEPLPGDARRGHRGRLDPRAAGDRPGRRPAAGRPRRPPV